MFGNVFYHSALRNLVIIFGTIFNDITLVKKNSSDVEVSRIKVPISYGPSQKWIARMNNKIIEGQVNLVYPRMSFEIKSVKYDPARKILKENKFIKDQDNNNTVSRVFNGVPYSVEFELNIIAKNIDEANQIVEQILPWFTPDYTTTLKSLPALDLRDDVKFVLNSVSFSDNYDENWVDRRDIIWTLSFSTSINFYGPVRDDKLITTVQVDVIVPPTGAGMETQADRDATARVQRITVVPDPIDALRTDDYGYTTTVEDFNDGKRFDAESGDDIPVDE